MNLLLLLYCDLGHPERELMRAKRHNTMLVFPIFHIINCGILLPTVRKNCFSDQEKLLKLEAEG